MFAQIWKNAIFIILFVQDINNQVVSNVLFIQDL